VESSHPTLVAAMIDVSITGTYANAISDGIKERSWGAKELAALQAQLQQINLLPLVTKGFDFERMSLCAGLETSSRGELVKAFYGDTSKPKSTKRVIFTRFVPRGWLYRNMVTLSGLFPEAVKTNDPSDQIVLTDQIDAASRRLAQMYDQPSRDTILALTAVPNFDRAYQRGAWVQTMANQTQIACALQRFHLEHSRFPRTLNDLVPDYLATIPHDLMGGGALHYFAPGDGTFYLYSVGWNGRDDNGLRVKVLTEGDWVWPDFSL
jgi:hypothetical protein